MSWSHISDGAWVFGVNASAEVVWPTHIDGDDAFLVQTWAGDIGSTIVTPTDWILRKGFSHNAGFDIVNIYSKKAVGASEGNVTISPVTLDSGDIISGFITVFRGGSFNESSTAVTNEDFGTGEIPYDSLTPAHSNCLALLLCNWGDVTPGWTTLDAEAGWTIGTEDETASGSDSGSALFWQIQTTPTATGSGSITSPNAVGGPTGSIVIAFQEAAPVGDPDVYVSPTPQRNVRHSGHFMRRASGLIVPRPGILRAA